MPTEIILHILIYSNSFRYGEVVPLGTNYLASYASGVRVGLKELCPKLIGQDPTQIKVINDFMDFHLKGHPYVKSPIDMACWDILGKVISTYRILFSWQFYNGTFLRFQACHCVPFWVEVILTKFSCLVPSAKVLLKTWLTIFKPTKTKGTKDSS